MSQTDSQEAEDLEVEVEAQSLGSCSQGHRSTLSLQTQQGGAICLLCLSNLITTPHALTIHVSYALSQLSLALSHRPLHLSQYHAHFLVAPLLHALSSFDDQPIACQLIDLITILSDSGDEDVFVEFVSRVAERLSSGAFSWSPRQLHMIHCLGVLFNCRTNNPFIFIKNKDALISNLVTGLGLPSEEIRGEILFVLYKVSSIQCQSMDIDGADILFAFCPKLLQLSLVSLMKTQRDDVRLNCVALLTILAQKGFLVNAYTNNISRMNFDEAENSMQTTDYGTNQSSLPVLFAEAIKGPLLSSDSQVQISTLDLMLQYLSWEAAPGKHIQILMEENIADYVFEALRLSECKDPMVNSCVHVLNFLLTAEPAFGQRLAVGFTTLIPVLNHVAEVPFHPVQSQTLKLIWNCISDFPGMISASHVKELILCLTRMLRRHTDGEMGMLPETFTVVCSIFVALLKSPSFKRTENLAIAVQEASKHAVLACLSISDEDPSQLLHSLYLLKEAYAYSYKEFSTNKTTIMELRNSIVDVCKSHLLPWFVTAINDINEEIVLGVLETFHSILLQDSDIPATEFAQILVASSWISLSSGCLGLFPTEKIKWRVYLMLSSLVDVLFGNDTGQPIRDAAVHIPTDPAEWLFLLGQKSSHNFELSCCQSAILLILHTAAIHDDRLADEKLVLASLEQYILVNSSNFQFGAADSLTMMWLVNLYGLYRSLAKMSYQIPYSLEAERMLFHLLTEKEWDLPSAKIHPLSLKWLFQQEKLSKPLSYQILKFCRSNSSNVSNVVVHGKSNNSMNEEVIAELVAAGDNYGASVVVCLLMQLIEQEGQVPDIVSVLNLVATAINILPRASDQFCLHGIINAICALYNNSSYSSLPQILTAISLLIFNILRSVHPEVLSLSDEAAWLTVTMKGPAMTDYDEEASTGEYEYEYLIFVLLLYYFSIRSLQASLPGALDWQNFLDPFSKKQSLSTINIRCHDLCRLMHFGSPLVKLVSSYCMLELFTRLSDHEDGEHDELECSMGFLSSVMAVLEGLVFYSDIRVAMNCGFCLSMILGWEKLDLHERTIIAKNYWCRLIVEEMAMSLAVPHLASKSFFNHHKPAVHIAVALLKHEKIPGWMTTVFDSSCISGIIGNLGASNMGAEMVLLFRELLDSEFLKAEQISSLNHVLQACRKYVYTNCTQDEHTNKHLYKTFTKLDDLGEVREYLIHLMSSQSSMEKNCRGLQNGDKELLEEIEMFFRSLTVKEHS
ncbi:protein putative RECOMBINATION INITIATION DEFECT 1 [Citrus sinensis]|uniref:Protein putative RECOMBINATION INITIATION DEFECT 1 n=1 Tax=Citrus sinensis TaxID=2711 RepID=A0ACB8HYM5_CITSI|nr:protein putative RECOMBINATION INITIATION DEFECT 1 [Citrus sinensis]